MPFRGLQIPHPSPTAQARRFEVFEQIADRRRIKAGQEIFGQEAAATRYFRIMKGVVRTTRLLPHGRRQVSGFYFAGDMFGLEIGSTHRHAAEALTDCEISSVKRGLPASVPEGARIERLIWEVTSEQLEQARERMLILAAGNAYEKVSWLLAEIADRAEGPWADLPMCRQDIADYLGLTIETVSRMLTQLRHDGLVRLDGARRFFIARAAHQTAGELAA